MESKIFVCNVGEWVFDLHKKQAFEIIDKKETAWTTMYTLNTGIIINKAMLNAWYKPAPAARVLLGTKE